MYMYVHVCLSRTWAHFTVFKFFCQMFSLLCLCLLELEKGLTETQIKCITQQMFTVSDVYMHYTYIHVYLHVYTCAYICIGIELSS